METDPPTPEKNSPTRIHFLPANVPFESLPSETQTALSTIVAPLYDEVVVRAESALERSAGLTLVHLVTLEVLEQIKLGTMIDFCDDSDKDSEVARDKRIDRHLRLLGAKNNYSQFLLRLQQFRAAKYADPHRKSRL